MLTQHFSNSAQKYLKQSTLLMNQRFNFSIAGGSIPNVFSGGSNKKITAKTLCEITGTRYYTHNEEIGYQPEKIVRVYDENDVLIGDMTF